MLINNSKFISSLENKENFIDIMWQSKRHEDSIFSVRSIIASSLFSPLSIYIEKVYQSLYETCADEFSFYIKLRELFINEQEYIKSFNSLEEKCIKDYDAYWKNFSGLNSIFAHIIQTNDYPPKFQNAKNQLVKWYRDTRIVEHGLIGGGVFNYVFISAFPAIINFIKELSFSVVSTLVSDKILNILKKPKSSAKIIEYFKEDKGVQKIINSNIPRNFLFENLFVLNITAEEIDEFKKITVLHLKKFIEANFPDKQLEMLEFIINNHRFKEQDLTTCKELFLKIEFDNGIYEYVFDPFFLFNFSYK